MSETNPPSGTDIVKLGISVDATQPEQAAEALDKLAAATVTAGKGLDQFNDTAAENQKWVSESRRKWMELEAQIKSESRAIQEAEKVQRDMNRAQEAAQAHAQDLIVKLNEMVATFGMSREEMLRYKAAQLGVSEATEPLIKQLERLRQSSEQNSIQQKRDIELANARGKAEQERTNDYIQWWEKELSAAEKSAKERVEIQKRRDTELHQMRAKEYSDYVQWWQKQLSAQDAALEQRKAVQQKRDMELYQLRQAERASYVKFWNEVIDKQEAASKEAVAIAERQAIQEIQWARMSTKQRIAELEKLQAYQANPSITSATIGNTFSGAALRDLPNLERYRKEADEAAKANERLRRSSIGLTGAMRHLRLVMTTTIAMFGVHEIVAMIDGYTKFTAQLKLTSDTQAGYNQALSDTRRIARTSESDLQNTGVLYARISRSLEGLGAAQQHVANITESVSLALRSGGASSIESASAMLQLSQAFAAGRLNGQEFNAVAEAAPRLMKILADSMGVPTGALKEMAAQGLITTEIMAGALADEKVVLALRKEAAEVRNIGSAMNVLKNSVMEFLGATAEATGFTKALTETIKALADHIQAVAAIVGVLTAFGLAKWLGLATLGFAGLATGIGAASVAIKAFFVSLGPIGWAILILGSLGAAWVAMQENAEKASKKAAESTTASTADIIQGLRKQIDTIKERNRIAIEGANLLQKTDGPDVVEMSRLRAEMQGAETGTGKYASLGHEQRMVHLQELGKRYGTLYALQQERNEALKEEQRIIQSKSAESWLDKLATKEEQRIKEIKEARKELGDDPRLQEVLKRIDDKYADKSKGRKGRAPKIDQELEAYKDLIASIRATVGERELELASDEKTTESQRLLIKLDNDLAEGKLKLKPIHEQAIRNELANLGVLELLAKKRKEEQQLAKEEAKWLEKIAAEKAAASQKAIDAAEDEASRNERLAETWGMTKTAIEDAELARLEEQLAQAQSIALCTAETSALEELIAAKRRNRDATSRLEDLEAGQKAAKELEKFLDPERATAFGDALKESFGRVGDALIDVMTIMEDMMEREAELAEQRQNAELAHKSGAMDSETYMKKVSELNNKETKDRIAGFGQMATVAKGFFSEQSNGYKMMDGLAKVSHAIQLGMMIKEMAMLAQKAVLNQAGGDPYSAWARMAAMAAAVAALGFAVGGGFSSGPDNSVSAEEMQKRQGSGTVFGDAAAKSESITKAIEQLADNSDETMPISQAMLRSLRAIELSMDGLANLLFRTYGLTSGNTLGFQASSKSNGLGGLWGTESTKLIDSGLYMASGASVGDMMGGRGFGQYGTTQTKETSWFGLKTKFSNDRIWGKIEEDLARQLGMVFTNMTDTMGSIGESLGYNADQIEQYVKGIHWPQGNMLSLRGLTGQELTDALNNWFSTLSDQIAEMTFGNAFKDFQRIGEGYTETLVRVANGVEKAKVELENLGIRAVRFQDIVNKQGDVDAEIIKASIVRHERYGNALSGVGSVMQNVTGTADELIDAYEHLMEVQRAMRDVGLGQINSALLQGSGGTDNLGDALKEYQDKFFSDSEKLAAMQKNLSEDFRTLGLGVVPKTREEFRKLVDTLGRNGSESAQKMLGRLLNLAGAFDETASMFEKVTGVVEESAEDILNAWQDITDSIVDEIKRIRGIVDEGSGMGFERAQAEFAMLTGQARAGDREAADKLPEISKTLLELAEGQAGSLTELNRIRAMTANSLEQTIEWFRDKYGVEIKGFASGGYHAGGYRIVGENGPEIEATGPSRIFSSQQTHAILGGDLKAELRALRLEVVQLRRENSAEQRSIARSTEKMEKIFTRNDTGNGLLTTDTLPS